MVSYLTALNIKRDIKHKVQPKKVKYQCINVKSIEEEEQEINRLNIEHQEVIPIIIREYIWS